MKVPVIDKTIDEFLRLALTEKEFAWIYPHSLVGQFHTAWKAGESQDLHARLDACLRSKISQNWWKRDGYRPKEMMLLLIQTDPELANIAWKDLQQESAALEGRLSRFQYYCDTLMQMYKEKNPLSVDTNHNQDAAVLSLYLAGLFPQQFTLYPGLAVFRHFCEKVGSVDIPVVDDLVRFAKVTSIIYRFLQKNESFDPLLSRRNKLSPSDHLVPLTLVYEYMMYMHQQVR